VLRAAAEFRACRVSLVQLCSSSRLQAPIDEMMTAHLKALTAYHQKQFAECYDQLVPSVMVLLKVFRQADSLWAMEPLCTLVKDMRVMAELADQELRKAGKSPTKMKDVGSQLMRVFRETLQGSGNRDKKKITLFVVNQLLKVYFSLNTLHLCKNLIKAIDSNNTMDFEDFSAAQRVTYKFFIGRLSVFNDDYLAANEHLTYALARCYGKAQSNKRTILTYLIPVRLLLGSCPRPQLLKKYNLGHYQPIVTALKTGNVKLLNATLQNHQRELIRTGTYILLEKLKSAVYRTLLRTIHVIHKTTGNLSAPKQFQLPIAKFQAGLQWMGVVMDLDEVECVLVNLIYRKYVKGYISHKNQILVLSKADAFPPLSAVFLNDPT